MGEHLFGATRSEALRRSLSVKLVCRSLLLQPYKLDKSDARACLQQLRRALGVVHHARRAILAAIQAILLKSAEASGSKTLEYSFFGRAIVCGAREAQ